MPRPEAAMLMETAFAKVNLALHVRDRRPDGYHALESLFVFAKDGDLLRGSLDHGEEISLTLDGPFGKALGSGTDNLVMRAARALQDHLGEARGAALKLTKNLPVASGIGGGSADAAATLRLLNRLWNARLPDAELERIGLSLGSDVPACVSSVTQMVCGRGEVLEALDVQGLEGTAMLLVNPGVGVSTADVFSRWDRLDRGPLTAATLYNVIASGRNDLEPAAIAVAPVVADVLSLLREQAGVRLARMSGSGATCFALFDDAGERAVAARAISAMQPGWWVMETEIGGA